MKKSNASLKLFGFAQKKENTMNYIHERQV